MRLGFLKKAEKLEKLLLVLLRYSDTGVFNLNLEELIGNSHSYVDLSVLGELKSIALQAKEHLHHSLLVWVHHEVVLATKKLEIQLSLLFIFLNVLKGCVQLDIIVLSLPLLYEHDVFNSWDNVELNDVFPEVTRLDLSIIKEVLNDEG